MDKPGGDSGNLAESSPSTSKNVENVSLKDRGMEKSVAKRGEETARPLAVSHDRAAMYTSGTASCKETSFKICISSVK